MAKATTEDTRAMVLESVGDRIIEETMRFAVDPEDVQLRLKLFAWMIVNDLLVIKFALPHHVSDPGIYHEKYGIFEFPWGDKVAFVGSANESIFGHVHNYEKIHVFRSWLAEDAQRVAVTDRDFEKEWSGEAPGLTVVPLSDRALKLITECAPEERPDKLPKKTRPNPEGQDHRWRHQEEAVKEFLKAGNGVIEMATGTGKTRTALKILSRLIGSGNIDGAIVTVDGTDLLDQWSQEILAWASVQDRRFSILRQYDDNHEVQSFALNSSDAVLVISRQQLSKLMKLLSTKGRSRLFVIHDEVHGLGSPSLRAALGGEHSSFGYRLGLSATPIREYDDVGTAFIESEIGPVIFHFDLTDAIKRGILCEFDYVPMQYDLTDDDKKRLQSVYSRQAARARSGNPMGEEELWMELAKVYKTAEQKPQIFAEFMTMRAESLRSALLFVEEKWYGDLILPIIDKYTHLYRTYYAEDDRANLIRFAGGEIDCLITCHRISQGIDIKNLKSVFLFSSARARLETVQRIGRCLRVDPNNDKKRALVVDFVRAPVQGEMAVNADQDRAAWLTELSKIVRSE